MNLLGPVSMLGNPSWILDMHNPSEEPEEEQHNPENIRETDTPTIWAT